MTMTPVHCTGEPHLIISMRAKDSINITTSITTSITTNTSTTTSITHEWVWHLIRGTIRLGLDTISSHMKDRRHAGLPFYIDDRRWPCPSIPAGLALTDFNGNRIMAQTAKKIGFNHHRSV